MVSATREDQVRLLELQAIDRQIQTIDLQLHAIAEDAQVATMQARQQQLDTDTALLRAAIRDQEQLLQRLVDDTEVVVARLSRSRDQMQSGAASARVIANLEHEITALVRRQEELEDQQLLEMSELESLQQQLAQVVASGQELGTELEALEQELAARSSQLQAEKAELSGARATLIPAIDSELLVLYTRVSEARGGIGAAKLERNTCGGCQITLNPAELEKIAATPITEIIRCEECGRILLRVEG